MKFDTFEVLRLKENGIFINIDILFTDTISLGLNEMSLTLLLTPL